VSLSPSTVESQADSQVSSRKKSRLQLVTARDFSDELLMKVIASSGARGEAFIDSLHGKASKNSQLPLSQLLERAKIVVWKADLATSRFTYVSRQGRKLLGYPIAEWYEPGFLSKHIHPEDRRSVVGFSERIPEGDQGDLTFRLIAKDGRTVWLRNLISIDYRNGKAETAYGLMLDVSDRKQAEDALMDLGGRLITTQEMERSRIARELHDDFNQRMALLSIELEQLGKGISDPTDHELFEKMQDQVKDISADIHRLSYQLHPSKLDHLGLVLALKSLCDEFSESSKIKVTCRLTTLPLNLSKDLELCLFRVAQEAIRNATKYSGARSIQVVLAKTKNNIRLVVSDNGCGFIVTPEIMQKGLGFISMRERLHTVNGKLNVSSQPRRGTRIEVLVPLVRESKARAGKPATN
jgi:PAS domain S-box-containing protein